MEGSEVSVHEVLVAKALQRSAGRWLSNSELATLVPNVAPRTIRAHTRKLVQVGLVDQAEVFPAHRYRWSDKASKRNAAYLQRLERAAEVFGVTPG